MKDQRKTKAQLIEELAAERRKATAAGRDADLALQLAAERVRATAMDMRGAHDLHSVVAEVYQSLMVLGIDTPAASVFFVDESGDAVRVYSACPNPRLAGFDVSYSSDVAVVETREIVTFGLPSKTTVEQWLQSESTGPDNGPDIRTAAQHVYTSQTRLTLRVEWKAGALSDYVEGADAARYEERFSGNWSVTNVPFRFGMIGYRERQHHPEHDDIVAELARGLELGFLRFLDFQKVEEQNRELTLQNALERVRAKALGMQQSDDIGEVTGQLFHEFNELGIPVRRSGIWLIDVEPGTSEMWLTDPTGAILKGEPFDTSVLHERPDSSRYCEAFRGGESQLYQKYSVAELIESVPFWVERMGIPFEYAGDDPSAIADSLSAAFPAGAHVYHIFMPQGSLQLIRAETLSEHELETAERFAAVFSFAYDRFLELRKLETQNRELQVEAALARVRSRAQGMHRSEELSQVAAVLFQEFKGLGIEVFRAGMWILDTQASTGEVWLTGMEGELRTGRSSIWH